jgi:AcrR family transcriptional regulator
LVSSENHRVRTPRQRRSRKTKARLLDAGQRLICRKGFHGTNSKEIAAAAGAAIGSFYAYFKDKKDLLFAVLDRYTERIFAAMPELPADWPERRDAKALIHGYVREVVKAHDLPELHRELLVVLRNDPDLEELIDRWQQRAVRQLESVLQSAAGSLRVRNTKAAAVLLHASLEAVIQRLTLYRADVEQAELVAELADMFCRYLLIDTRR